MKALRRTSTIAAIASFVLIFTGGLVRVSGAGLGCPDWPKCFGRWLPPTHVSQLPPNMDPSLFNFTLAWIEYGNRMLGMVVGLLVLATAILATVQARRWKQIWMPAWGAALLIAYIGWQGGQVVASALEPLLVSTHMIGALLVASLALISAQRSHYIAWPEAERESSYPADVKLWTLITWGVILLQSALGTQVRAAVKHLETAQPMAGHDVWLNAIGPVRHIHEALGVLGAGLVAHLALKLLRRSESPSPLVVQSARAGLILAALQVVAGVTMLAGAYLDILKLVHLWVAGLLIGLLLLIYGALSQSQRGNTP